MKTILFLGCMIFSCISFGQKFEFYPSDYARFLGEKNDTLYNAFTGGLANPMFSNIDLNNDGRQDLFVFDRRDGKVLTFMSVKTKDSVRMQYVPQFEAAFPKILNWVILKDFDGDGKADIFMHGAGLGSAYSSHLVVYKNVSTASKLAFQAYQLPVMKITKYDTSKLTTDSQEIPTFADMDGDGDIDILQFDYFYGGLVYYYKNMSMEKVKSSNPRDSLLYYLNSQCWGYFAEFDTPEPVNVEINKTNCDTSFVKRQKHGSHDGSTLLAVDTDGDGDKDLLVGDVGRPNLVWLENGRIYKGNSVSIFDTVTSAAGSYPFSKAANMLSMPLANSVDINGDGTMDLLVSPMDVGSKRKDFIWFYNNTSHTAKPQFTYNKSNFLEESMIDWGNYSTPSIIYYNNDNLPDLLVSVQGEVNGMSTEHLVLYLNVGTKEKAVFKLEDADFMAIGNEKLNIITPVIADADGDGKADLLLGHSNGTLTFYQNIGTNGKSAFSWPAVTIKEKVGAQQSNLSVGTNSRPAFADINNDGKLDLLIGNATNYIAYYKNITTTSGSPLFEKVTDSFLKFTNETQLAPCLSDLDSNGKPELLIGSASGKIYMFANISDSSKMLSAETNIIYNYDTKTFGANTAGKNTTVAVASLDQDGKPDLLVGNLRGGLYFMGSKDNGQKIPLAVRPDILPEEKELKMSIYPNPAKQNITLQWENTTPQNMQLVLTDVTGKQIWSNTFYANSGSSSQKIQLPFLANGLYFVRVSGSNGKVFITQKLFIAK